MGKLKEVIIEAIQDKKGRDILSLDLSGIEGAVCDTFVICNADSTAQVAAIADHVEEEVEKKTEERLYRCEGKDNGIWVVMDYSDVVVHIFQTEFRKFYALEEVWADVPVQQYESFA